MAKPTDIRPLEITTATEEVQYRTPMKFGGRVVTAATLLHVTATVETRDGRRGVGAGSMPLGNVWAWPSQDVAAADTLSAMLQFGQRSVAMAREYTEFAHPLRIGRDLADGHAALAAELKKAAKLPEQMPVLAQLVAASPLDAALHDAFGKALGRSAFQALGHNHLDHDLTSYLNADFAGEYLDQYVLAEPRPRMPLYHLVGALDPLTSADVPSPVGDGLPETLGEWIAADGLTHLKIKLNGDDLQWDIARVAAVEAVAAEAQQARGCAVWHYSLDFNERCASVDYVLEFLTGIRERSPRAFQRVQYIEQPTHRDLKAHPENHIHAAAKIKPVVIDESLVDLESLLLAREMGYSGVALKACKGHGEALLMGAAAQKYGLFLCVQDLTCPGASFLHSASLAAHVPTVAAIEGNARQYCPAGNLGWSERFPTLFQVRDGALGTAALNGPGLGF